MNGEGREERSEASEVREGGGEREGERERGLRGRQGRGASGVTDRAGDRRSVIISSICVSLLRLGVSVQMGPGLHNTTYRTHTLTHHLQNTHTHTLTHLHTHTFTTKIGLFERCAWV